jgi:hypothetical protein
MDLRADSLSSRGCGRGGDALGEHATHSGEREKLANLLPGHFREIDRARVGWLGGHAGGLASFRASVQPDRHGANVRRLT